MRASRSNGVLQLQFKRATGAIDLTYIVEGSYAVTNQAAWTAVNSNYHGGAWSDPAGAAESGAGSAVNVTVNDNVAGATNRYLRLRVTKP
jgi:hypothetical protein